MDNTVVNIVQHGIILFHSLIVSFEICYLKQHLPVHGFSNQILASQVFCSIVILQ